MMTNYRAAVRREAEGNILIEDAILQSRVALLRDLSSNGMRVAGSHRFQQDALYQWRFAVPDLAGDDGSIGGEIECAVQILWVRADPATGLYVTGARIILVNARVVDAIEHWALKKPQAEY